MARLEDRTFTSYLAIVTVALVVLAGIGKAAFVAGLVVMVAAEIGMALAPEASVQRARVDVGH